MMVNKKHIALAIIGLMASVFMLVIVSMHQRFEQTQGTSRIFSKMRLSLDCEHPACA